MPHDPGAVLKFVQDASLKQSTLVMDAALVVHSSEGIGRTGTFIAVEIMLNLIAFQGECVCMTSHTAKLLSLANYFILLSEYFIG